MYDVIIIGSGMGSLSAGALLAKEGLKPLILEQNWIPGGCTTSYWRKGFVFEAGATTLVGLDRHMPLRHLLDETGIRILARKLKLPMQVHMTNGSIVNKYQDQERWINESEKHFPGPQRAFWKQAFDLSQFVWKASTKYLHFPPKRVTDYFQLAAKAHPADLLKVPYAFKSTASVLDRYQFTDPAFRSYIDEQLLITAQNRASEVNFLFGAAALCYTNYGNYYIDGGLINLVKPIVSYIESKGGQIIYREGIEQVKKVPGGYQVKTKKNTYQSKYLISGIPINNLAEHSADLIPQTIQSKLLTSPQLYSAFQMGIAFKSDRHFESLHHQVHLETPLPETGSKSIFVSLSHESDTTRSDIPGARVASVSTHIPDPAHTTIDSGIVEKAIVAQLVEKGFLKEEDILYTHSSGPKSWKKWTNRAHGFVGGYPQYLNTLPWQMIEARLDGKGAYQCGDTAYPGQGIPGATLSGIIAARKLSSDWL